MLMVMIKILTLNNKEFGDKRKPNHPFQSKINLTQICVRFTWHFITWKILKEIPRIMSSGSFFNFKRAF